MRAAGVRQSRLCRDNGSPTYAAIIDALVSRLGGDDPAVTLLRNDPRPPVQSALYLRLLGAVHRIALSRPDCPLRRYFPSAGGHVDPQAAVEAFFRVVAAHAAAVAVDMRADVQTNEVGRSAPLSAAMNYLTVTAGLPLRLLEVGASAGLNLWMDGLPHLRALAGERAAGACDVKPSRNKRGMAACSLPGWKPRPTALT